MPSKIIRKTNFNKRTKQLTVTIPKKSLPPNLRYSRCLFVKLEVLDKKKKRG